LGEIAALVAEGVVEVTLLGQNVNTYGVEFGDKGAFAKLLRACGKIDGLERVRFTSPHPAAFTNDVIDAMAETPNVMPQLHMPLQSGSDRILKEMRRSYRSEKFLGILDRVRKQIPNAAISTDLIVGFPGETEEEFLDTLRVVEQSRFAVAYTFQYSKRPGTPAATYENQLPKEIVQDRYERLLALVNDIAWQENKKQIGSVTEVLVMNGGRKDEATNRMSGRNPENRLVHFELPVGAERPRPGDMVTVQITDAAPYHLLADDTSTYSLRRTKSGDAWDAAEAAACAPETGVAPNGKATVSLGLPTIGNQNLKLH
ncbi:MAG: MiaB/RimO family radical SAM methylthiotransferase, partial [Rhodoluna sp.]